MPRLNFKKIASIGIMFATFAITFATAFYMAVTITKSDTSNIKIVERFLEKNPATTQANIADSGSVSNMPQMIEMQNQLALISEPEVPSYTAITQTPTTSLSYAQFTALEQMVQVATAKLAHLQMQLNTSAESNDAESQVY